MKELKLFRFWWSQDTRFLGTAALREGKCQYLALICFEIWPWVFSLLTSPYESALCSKRNKIFVGATASHVPRWHHLRDPHVQRSLLILLGDKSQF